MLQNNSTPAKGVQTTINVLNDEDVAYWTKRYNITQEQLRNAVFIAGKTTEEVEAYLRRHGLIEN